MNSRAKGARGEREWRDKLVEHGFEARRGQQYSGLGAPDVVSSLEDIHWEVKRCQKLHLYTAMEQARSDAGEEQMPVVAHRKNEQSWVVILDANDFLSLLNRLMKSDV